MNPDITSGGIEFALQCAETAPLPSQHQFGFGVAYGSYFNGVAIGCDAQVIDGIHVLFSF
jgi:hypothetical protein